MNVKHLLIGCLTGLLACFSWIQAKGSGVVYVTDTVSVCDNSFPFVYKDTTFYGGTTSGTYNVRVSHGGVLDSMVSLTLFVNRSYSVFDTLQLCQSDLPYQYGNVTISATTPVGNFIRVLYLQTVSGCDSVVYLTLRVLPSYSRSKNVQICSSDLPFSYGGRVLTTAGTYRITLQTVNGCDSVINLTLGINPSHQRKDTVKICPTAFPFQYVNRWFAAAGDYRVDAMTKKGCDSTIYLHLETYQFPMTFDTIHICAADLPYRYGNTLIYDQGSWDIPLVSKVGGCDSIVRLQVVTEPLYRQKHYIYVCSNDFPYTYGNQTLRDSGYYEVHMQSVYGCDSVIDLYVSVADPHSVTIYDTVCQGDGYNHYGFYLPPSATHLDRLTIHGRKATIHGCDSNITIHVTFTPVYYDTDNVEICETLLPYRKHGRIFARTGDYLLRFQSVHGCDSTILFRLKTTKVYNVQMTDHFCAGGSTYKLGDSTFTDAGDYKIVMNTQSGCDSVIYLHLVKDERTPYYPGDIYNKKDLYQTDKQTFWISSVPNAHQYEWYFTNSGWRTEGITNDYVFALRNIQEGDTGTVSVRAVNACGASQWSDFKIGITGIASYHGHPVKVYPNPTNGALHVETDAAANLVVLYDVSGRELQRVTVLDGKADLTLDVFAPGMYILHIRADRQILQMARVVKQ